MQSQLPSDLAQAESMLEQHKRKKTEILQLINFTNEEGENIVTRVRQQVSKDFWEIRQFAVLCQCTEICRVLEDLLFWNRVLTLLESSYWLCFLKLDFIQNEKGRKFFVWY